MTIYQQNIAIAEACDVKPLIREYVVENDHAVVVSAPTKKDCQEWLDRLPEDSPYKKWTIRPWLEYPNYAEDLNAMNQIERYAADNLMDSDQWEAYGKALERIHPTAVITGGVGNIDYHDLATLLTGLTAEMRAEAFLRTIGKWIDS